MMRVLIITAGAEAAVSLVLQSVQGNLFYTGFLTRNRNTYSMLVMTCAPVIGWYAAAESRKRYACIYSTILILVFSAVLSAGALAGGLAGVGALLICRKRTGKLLLFACIPALIGTGIVCIRPEGGRALRASIIPNLRENFLVKQRGPEYTQRKDALIGTAPQWFADHTAVRYRRWRYGFKHAGESLRKLLVGSGPSSFNEALKPYSAAEGSPNIDTDEISMFNIGVNEPDTFSAYTVWLAGYGIIGLAALAALLLVPAIRGLANGQGPSAAAGAALLALAVCDLFHAHTITGMYSMAAALIYCAAADFSHTGPSVQEYPDD